MKTLKFANHLVPLVLSGEKDATWRLFDDKDLKKDDQLLFINKDTSEKFGEAIIVSVREKRLGDIQDSDFDGHEKFESVEKMYEEYKKYYGDKVNTESIVKMVKFRFLD